MECPKCSNEIGKARYCGCGWKQAGKGDPQKSAGIGQCAWLANGEQCHYPGTISFNTQGMGPWYCRFHAVNGITAHHGEQVVIASRDYVAMDLGGRDAQHLTRLKDPNFKPRVRACEEKRCIKPGTLQPNGKYLCHTHRLEPSSIEYYKPRTKGNVAEQLREPGDDVAEAA